jgi:hypothetical protein
VIARWCATAWLALIARQPGPASAAAVTSAGTQPVGVYRLTVPLVSTLASRVRCCIEEVAHGGDASRWISPTASPKSVVAVGHSTGCAVVGAGHTACLQPVLGQPFPRPVEELDAPIGIHGGPQPPAALHVRPRVLRQI